MKNKVVALSAISAGFIAILLTLGAYVQFLDVFSLVIASICVMLPLYLNSYKGSFLAYLAGGVIAFLFSGFNLLSIIFPSYFLFFGAYPILFYFLKQKNAKKIVRIIIGLIWCIAYMIGIFYYYYMVMKMPIGAYPVWAEWFVENIILVVIALAVLFYFIYDRFIELVKRLIDYNLQKIIKK